MMNLPVLDYEAQIVQTVAANAVTIIQADTGAGKSTQIPQMLYRSGMYSKITITQPRVASAVTLAERVSEELCRDIGTLVGYKTRFYKTEKDTPITYVTDGYLLSLYRHQTYVDDEVIILDEIHEFNVNMETLLGLYKQDLSSGQHFKLVIMSATMDAKVISDFFDGAPIIQVPGKTYPVKKLLEPTLSRVACIKKYFTHGSNMLVFLPGKQEISDCYDEIVRYFRENFDTDHPYLFEFHGEMTYKDQKKAFEHYEEGKIVLATNAAQTGITIPDIDFVIDTGTCKEMISVNGVSQLVLTDISQAESDQRAGRSARCKPGTYVLCSRTDFAHRKQFPVPEIQRISLESLVLKLATIGLDPTEIEFLHNPDRKNLNLAKELLYTLEALKDGSITSIGEEMERMPVSPRIARMLIEARKYSANVQGDMAIIAAIFECGDFRNKYFNVSVDASSECQKSDLTYQLLLVKEINHLWHSLAYEERKDFYKNRGVKFKIFQNILKVAKDIADKLNLKYTICFPTKDSDYMPIRNCIISAFHDCIYSFEGYRRGGSAYYIKANDYTPRTLDKNSVFVGGWNYVPDFVLAQPLDLYNPHGLYGPYTINLLKNATAVDTSNDLIFQHLLSCATRTYSYDEDSKVLYEVYAVNGIEIKRERSSKIPVLKKEASWWSNTTFYYNVFVDGIQVASIPA